MFMHIMFNEPFSPNITEEQDLGAEISVPTTALNIVDERGLTPQAEKMGEKAP